MYGGRNRSQCQALTRGFEYANVGIEQIGSEGMSLCIYIYGRAFVCTFNSYHCQGEDSTESSIPLFMPVEKEFECRELPVQIGKYASTGADRVCPPPVLGITAHGS